MTSFLERLLSSRRLLAFIAAALLANLAAVGWLAVQSYLHYRNRFVEQAEEELVSGHLDRGIAALQAHLRLYPADSGVSTRLDAVIQDYRAQLLERTEAAINVDDRISAVGALKQYILLTPGDAAAQIRLAGLYEDSGNRESAEQIYRRVLARSALQSTDPGTWSRARTRLFKLVNTWANELKQRADALDEQGDSSSSAALYEQVIALRARNPALDTHTLDRTLALEALDAVVARRALALWHSGVAPGPAALQTRFDKSLASSSAAPAAFLADRVAARRTRLSDLIWETGDMAVAREDWRGAVDAYNTARQLRPVEENNQWHDLNLAALRYNQALAEFMLGNYSVSVQHLEELARDTPEYEHTKVSTLLGRARAANAGAQDAGSQSPN